MTLGETGSLVGKHHFGWSYKHFICIRIVVKPTPSPPCRVLMEKGYRPGKRDSFSSGVNVTRHLSRNTKMGEKSHGFCICCSVTLMGRNTTPLWSLPPNFHRDSNISWLCRGCVWPWTSIYVSCKGHVVPRSGRVATPDYQQTEMKREPGCCVITHANKAKTGPQDALVQCGILLGSYQWPQIHEGLLVSLGTLEPVYPPCYWNWLQAMTSGVSVGGVGSPPRSVSPATVSHNLGPWAARGILTSAFRQ